MSTDKQDIIDLVNAQPENSSYSDIANEVVFNLMVDRALEESKKVECRPLSVIKKKYNL